MSPVSEHASLLTSLDAARSALESAAVTSAALVQAAIDVVRATNGTINAFVSIDEVAALAAAQAADARRRDGQARSAWDGIPIGIKDNIDVAGFQTSNGIVKAAVARVDADCVRPWRDAGFIILGKLNMHEAALGTTTENPHFGSTRNPIDSGFSAGGSSGGSAAAVAAGMVPLALGSDTMGSIRLPAANCGIFGWKPAQYGQSLNGVCVLHPDLDAVGPLVNSIRDLGHAMDILAVPALTDETATPVVFSVLEDVDADAWHEDVRMAWARLLDNTALRHVSLDGFAPTPVRRALLLEIETRLADVLSPAMQAHASPALKSMLEFGASVSKDKSEGAKALIETMRAQWLALMSDVDVLITPATPIPPTALGAAPVAYHADLLLAANLIGCPAAVMPFTQTANGLPLGLHLMTRAGNERRLLVAMRQLQADLA